MLSALAGLNVSRLEGAVSARSPARGPSTSKMLIHHLPRDPTNLFLALLAAFGFPCSLSILKLSLLTFKSARWALGDSVAEDICQVCGRPQVPSPTLQEASQSMHARHCFPWLPDIM